MLYDAVTVIKPTAILLSKQYRLILVIPVIGKTFQRLNKRHCAGV